MERVRTKAELAMLERAGGAARTALMEAKPVARTRTLYHFLIRDIANQVLSYHAKRYDYDAVLLTLYLYDGRVAWVTWSNVIETSMSVIEVPEGLSVAELRSVIESVDRGIEGEENA